MSEAAPRGRRTTQALVAAVVSIGLLLVAVATWVVKSEYDRQLRVAATGARATENQIAALVTAANQRVLTLRSSAQYAYQAIERGGAVPTQGVRGNTLGYRGSVSGTPADIVTDRAVVEELWLTLVGVHAAAPDIALSYVMSARTGFAANYPRLPDAEHLAMARAMARKVFDPATHQFIQSVAHRPETAPPLWTAVYRDNYTGRTRAGRVIRGDGRLVSLLAPVWVDGQYRMMAGIDVWANDLREILRNQPVPGVELTLVDGNEHVIATSRAADIPLAAGPFSKAKTAGTEVRDFLGFDPDGEPPRGVLTGKRVVRAQAIGDTPLRVIAIADMGNVTRQVLFRLGALLAVMLGLYALLCLVAWYVLRRVLAPAFRLAGHIERSGTGTPPEVSRLWRPTLAAIDAAFAAQRGAVARLEEAHATTSAVLDAAFDAVVLADADLRVVSANMAFTRMFAPTGVASIGRPLPELIAPAEEAEPIGDALRFDGESMADAWPFEARGVRGRRFPAELQARRLQQGGRALIVVFIRDITERRRIEGEVASQREALHQSEKMTALGSLLAGVSHELNNPLAVVLGRSTVLAEQLAGTPHESALQKLRSAADRCGRIVRTFLAMARRSAPERSAVDINALVNDALEITGYGLRTAGIELVLDLDTGLPRTSADGDQLVQVVINLLINAQHALAALPDGAPREVRIETARDAAGRILLTVRDTGPGVPDAVRRRIFEPFFTTKPVGEGTGMGLSVSRGIVEAHEGALELVSGAGDGAAFRITLPVEPVAPVRTRQAPRPATGGSRGRILIVDDEADVAELIEECLRPLGAAIRVVHGGEAALAEIAAGWFDVVVCDVRMAGMDGFETWRRATAARAGQGERFLFLTGDILAGDTSRRAAEIGRPVIEKPFDPAEIRAAVEAVLAEASASETIETR